MFDEYQPRRKHAPLPAVILCEQCGGSLVAGKRFCKYCGHPAEAAAPSKPAVADSAPRAMASVSPVPPPGVPIGAAVEMTQPAQLPIDSSPDAAAALPAPTAQIEVRREAPPSPPPTAVVRASSALPERDIEALQASFTEAVRHGDLGTVRAMLRANPDLVFSEDEEQWTPLHWAAGRGQRDVAELLLACGAEPSAKALEDRTPLHFAAFKGHKDIVELLVANGANVSAMTRSGESPLYVAGLGGHREVAELLHRRGAQW
jgi:hypothetical protein